MFKVRLRKLVSWLRSRVTVHIHGANSCGHGVTGSPSEENLPSPGRHQHTCTPVAFNPAHLPGPAPRACADADGPPPTPGGSFSR